MTEPAPTPDRGNELRETCEKYLQHGPDEHGQELVRDLLAKLDEQREVIEEQADELAEVHEDAFCEIGMKVNDGSERDGWWDSMARSDACEHGNWLVEHGTWERHPDGYGRRWFYRPLAASAGSDKPMTSREARDKLNARSHEIMRETREGSDE